MWLITVLRAASPLHSSIPDAAPLPHVEHTAGHLRRTQPIRTTQIPTTHRTGVTLPRGLTRNSQRTANVRPGATPIARRSHVQHRR